MAPNPRTAVDKVRPAAALVEVLRRPRDETLVFTNGVFDVLHRGHHHCLETARAMGDALIVAVNGDASARALDKGSDRPVNGALDRARLIAALECVDHVCVFEEPTPEALIEALLPDVLVKGADYSIDEVVGRAAVEAAGGRVELVPLLPGFSSTAIIERRRTERPETGWE